MDRPFSVYRLPPGRHGLAPEQVAENQRWRLLGAAAEVFAECGYAKTTARRITTRAGVSSSTFYRHFENVDECMLATYEMTADCVLQLVSGACEAHPRWPDRLAASIHATFGFFAAEPALARIFAAEAPFALAAVAASRERLLARLARLLWGGRRPPGEAAGELTPGAERTLVAGVFAFASNSVAEGELERLPGLVPQIVELLLFPDLGWEEAARLAGTTVAD